MEEKTAEARPRYRNLQPADPKALNGRFHCRIDHTVIDALVPIEAMQEFTVEMGPTVEDEANADISAARVGSAGFIEVRPGERVAVTRRPAVGTAAGIGSSTS